MALAEVDAFEFADCLLVIPRRVRAAHPSAGAVRGRSFTAPLARLYSGRTISQPGDTMAIQRTLSIIKPDATRRNLTGQINARFEAAGLRIVAQRRLRLTRAQAEAFYAVHKERPFYASLCDFMTSGPVVAQVLEGEGAVERNREVMGATDPAKADLGTIRKDLAESIEANSVHGSDAAATAAKEIAFFFAEVDIVG